MPHLPFFSEMSPLYALQAALTIWMLVDAGRRGVEGWWFWIILFFQPLGAWAYFFLYKVKDFAGGGGRLAGLFSRRPSLDELRRRLERSPTAAAHLELGEGLVKAREYAEAVPHLEAVLAREPEHCRALFLLAASRRGLGRPDLAAGPLQKLVGCQPGWRDYEAWRTLVAVCREAGDSAGALARCRDLARVVPSLEHRCLLGENLLEAGEKVEARRVVELGLEEYRDLTGPSRRRDRRWVGKARQILAQSNAAE
jgi:hypothetical protein